MSMPSEATEATRAVGEKIRMLREMKDWTQAHLGELVFAAQPTVANWESGLKTPRKPMQFRLADVFGVSRSQLFAEVLTSDDRKAA